MNLFCSPHLVVHGTASCPVCIQGQILHFHNFTLGSWDPENLPHSPLSELSQCWSVSGEGGGCRTQRRPIQKPSQPELAASLLYRLLLGFGESHKSRYAADSHRLDGSACETQRPACEHKRTQCPSQACTKVPTHIFLCFQSSQRCMIAIAEKLNFERRPTQMCGE